MLARINPWVRTRTETENLADPNVLANLVSSADVVISAIGDDLQETLLGEAIYASTTRPSMILVRTLHGGAAFRVVLIRPGVDACIECLASYRQASSAQWISVPPRGLKDLYDTGCAAPARPGTGLSSLDAAIFAAARAIDLLEDDAGDINHWLWVERAIASADPRLTDPHILHTATFRPLPGCRTCGA
ncbi:MAG TPA: hypothetical protein VI300_26335, partial [Solirubrobacter sp.]